MGNYGTTLCILRDGRKILLGRKKRGFGMGKYNGIGGKIELGERPEQAMVREVMEEIGVEPIGYRHMATLQFREFYKGKEVKERLEVYIAEEWQGEPRETEEMAPKWFDVGEIPFEKMLPDDYYWLPLVLKGKRLRARFRLGENLEMLEHEVMILK